MIDDLQTAGRRIGQSRILLGREAEIGPGVRRAAALVARQALEELVDVLWQQRGLGDMADASMRTQLLCLRDVLEPELAGSVSWNWGTMSTVSHDRGYAMVPSVQQIEHCLEAALELYEYTAGATAENRLNSVS